MELIAQGAEAKLYRNDNSIIKERIRKSYRIEEIDDKLRRSRTRREAKILEKLAAIDFPAPRLIENDKKERLVMEFIDGDKVRDILEKKDYISLSKEIGKKIAILHNHGILHGDLTTSNMILDKEVFFIDFGLGFFSKRLEDKAVDLHLFRQALESKHHKVWEKCFDAFIKEYEKHAEEGDKTLIRLKEVEGRGRNKNKH
ncbi:MAG: Kae1-associated serine/threonine protein kinase [Nanoarchaeota archaeon]|nr:Kae1-associated serine/threonine protein kinase [Nanoarchaeota archaeon]